MKNKRNNILTEARKSLNLSQREFAEKIGTGEGMYNGIERLKYFPGKKCQEKISKFLIDSGIYLFGDELFPKELYSIGEPNIEFLSLDELEENEIPYDENQIVEDANQEHLKNGIERVFNTLPDKQRIVLTEHFLHSKSLEDISKIFYKKVTHERVRQIREKALNRCRCRIGLPGWSIFPMKDYLID